MHKFADGGFGGLRVGQRQRDAALNFRFAAKVAFWPKSDILPGSFVVFCLAKSFGDW